MESFVSSHNFNSINRNFIYGTQEDDTISGGSANSAIYGRSENIFYGDDGDDLLIAGLGSDRVSGGTGTNTIVGAQDENALFSDGRDTLFIVGGNDSVYGNGFNDTVLTLEALETFNPSLHEMLTTEYHVESNTQQSSQIRNGGGDDVIQLIGDYKYWSINAGQGNDIAEISGSYSAKIIGNKGNDVLDVSNVTKAQLYGSAGNDTIDTAHIENAYLLGDDGDDLITVGDNVTATILGGADDDTITRSGENSSGRAIGGTGNDLIIETNNVGGFSNIKGGPGDDEIIGSSRGQIISGGFGDDTIYGAHEYTSSHKGDRIKGDTGNDLLVGGNGRDTLYGGSGNDTLIAGEGADRYYGGSGADVFDFITAQSISGITNNTRDRVFDFSQSDGDKLIIGDVAFIGEENFSGGVAQARFFQQIAESGYTRTVIEIDANTDGITDSEIQFSKQLIDFTADDFIV